MKKAITYVLVLALSMGYVLTGCTGKPLDSSADKSSNQEKFQKKRVVAFVPGLINDAFYISIKKGLENKAGQYGFTVLFQGTTEWDYAKQIPVIENMIARKVDMLITAPASDDTMTVTLKKCSDSGIPVITIDTNIKDDTFLVANITSDNVQGGKAAAQVLAGMIGKKGEVAIINTKPGITTSDARVKGFEEELAAYPDIKLVSKQYCNNQSEKAAAQIQEILLQYPGLDGAFGSNLFSAIGIAYGLKASGIKIPIVCYDAGPTEVEKLRKGEIAAIVAQKPLAIGEMAGDYVNYFFSNQKDKIIKKTLIPIIVATRENMDDPEIKKWFYTMEQ